MSRRKTVRSFAIRDLDAWQKFCKLMEREGRSASEQLEEWIVNHVRIHWPGNPQPPLDSYVDGRPVKPVCLDGERNWCPSRPKFCVLKDKYRCKFDQK